MKRRVLTIALLGMVMLSMVFTGCQKKDSTAAGEKKVLSLWTWKVAMTPGFIAAGELFEQKTGYKLEVEAYTPDDTYRQKVLAAANSGDLPDLIHWWATRGVNFENVLTEFTTKADQSFRDKFSSTAFSNSVVRESDVRNWAGDPERSDVVKALKVGQLYQIPIDVGGFFTIFANNEILRQVGLENKTPADYEEFIQFAAKVARDTEYGGFVFAGGLPDVYYNWMGRAIEAQYLGTDVSVALWNNKAKMSDPKNIQPLKAFEALCRAGAVMDGIAAMNIDQGDAAFAAGQAAFLLGGTFTYGQLSAMGMDMNNVFSFVIPMMKGSAITKPYGINPFPLTAIAVPQTSKNQDAAWDFINFIALDPEGVPAFANGAYIIPAGKLDSAAISRLSPAIQDMYTSLVDDPSVTTIVDNDPNNIGRRLPHEELYKDMQRILIGEMTAEQAAANYDANIAAQWAAGRQ
ncbi:hypothetical protein FACS189485_04730 [Spirochaetia bacterium]|nr:hypothetical protein FACS189485_04730 [Spirochaetia bacterium]